MFDYRSGSPPARGEKDLIDKIIDKFDENPGFRNFCICWTAAGIVIAIFAVLSKIQVLSVH